MTEPLVRLTEFGRALRAEGLPAGTGRIEAFCRAAAILPVDELYWAGRATLVSRHDDIAAYDDVFRSFFGPDRQQDTPLPPPPALSIVEAEEPHAGEELDDTRANVGLASRVELLRHKSFSACDADDLAAIAELMARLRIAAPPRRTRRRRAARHGDLDVRRTVRRALRTDGDPAWIARRERRLRPRRLVLLLDVSGSMSAYSRALFMFAYAALRADPRWEAFCFGT